MISAMVIFFSLYAFLEGEREAKYFHFRWKHEDEKIKDEHLKFTIQRSIVALFATGCGCIFWSWFGLLTLPCMALMFPFFHDGAYYLYRNKIDESVYKKGWWDNTTSSSAKISITPVLRTVFMVVGITSGITCDILFTLFL